MEPLFRQLVVGLVPQPTQIPPAPFAREDLQRAFFDVTREHPYQQFAFLPGDSGAEFANSVEDGVAVQPALIQVRTPVDLTPERAREKAIDVVRVLRKRLAIASFLLCGIKVVAHVPAPGEARTFVAERLMREAERIEELGPHYFAGGLKYRSLEDEGLVEGVLLVEPLIQDDKLIFIDYDIQRRTPSDGSQLGEWIDDAFAFVRGPAIQLLKG